jgi:hypothetical protein
VTGALLGCAVPKAVSLHDIPALAVACRDIDVRNVKALIIGPHETPYEFGFFEVTNYHPRQVRLSFTANNFAVRIQVQQG